MPSLVAPVRLRATLGPHSARKVTWLELFFDLIFVAAVAQVAEPLHHHYTAGELLRLAPLLTLIWWAWTGHSFFATRFDTDDPIQRVLTLVQMFVVAVMAANAKDALDSRSSAGFAAAYAAVRLLLVAQYARVRQVPAARGLATRYVAGHGGAAAIWLLSSMVPVPTRFWLWGLAFVIDLGTPWLAVRHSVDVPHNEHHLPERFGLFTIILFGEAIVAVMIGMESQETWPIEAALSAFLSMALLFMLWWWYFDGAAGASEQPVRTKRDAVRLNVWTYVHFPLYLAIVVIGVGLNKLVMSAAHQALERQEVALLAYALGLAMLTLTVIGAVSASRTERTQGWAHAGLAAATIAAGAMTAPAVLIVLMSALCLAQLLLSLRRQAPASPL